MSIFKRTQRKYVKKAYRVRNWREYEAGLRNRGSLTVWISLTAGKLVNWDASSRQSEGLLRSLFALMKLDNDVPDHTTISRRKAKLGKVPFYQDKQKTPLHILIDSSGLAVHAGQLRRAPNSRDYRKLHLCVDEQSGFHIETRSTMFASDVPSTPIIDLCGPRGWSVRPDTARPPGARSG